MAEKDLCELYEDLQKLLIERLPDEKDSVERLITKIVNQELSEAKEKLNGCDIAFCELSKQLEDYKKKVIISLYNLMGEIRFNSTVKTILHGGSISRSDKACIISTKVVMDLIEELKEEVEND